MRSSLQASTLLTLVGFAASLPTANAWCWSWDRYCNDGSGLSTGAKWGIGVGVAVGVILLCLLLSFWRRR